MKVLLSSKRLAQELSSINFQSEFVRRVSVERDELTIITGESILKFDVHVLDYKNPVVLQKDKRWDWVWLLVNRVDDQPVILDIYENVVNVTFQY
jgi:hypothetical protein